MTEENTAVQDDLPPADDQTTPPVEGEQIPVDEGGDKPAEGEQKPKADEKKPDKPHRRARTERHISKLTREANTAKEDAAYWKGKAEALEQTRQKPDEPERPIRADYDDEDDYIEALTDYKVERKSAPKYKPADVKPPSRDVKPNPAAEEFALKGTEAYGDEFAAAMGDTSLPVTQLMGEAMYEADNGPDLLMYLSDHPTEARRIAKMSIAAQVREMDKLNTKVGDYSSSEDNPGTGDEASPLGKKQSSAPPPHTPEKGSGDVPGGETDLSKITDIDAWMTARRKSKRTH